MSRIVGSFVIAVSGAYEQGWVEASNGFSLPMTGWKMRNINLMLTNVEHMVTARWLRMTWHPEESLRFRKQLF